MAGAWASVSAVKPGRYPLSPVDPAVALADLAFRSGWTVTLLPLLNDLIASLPEELLRIVVQFVPVACDDPHAHVALNAHTYTHYLQPLLEALAIELEPMPPSMPSTMSGSVDTKAQVVPAQAGLRIEQFGGRVGGRAPSSSLSGGADAPTAIDANVTMTATYTAPVLYAAYPKHTGMQALPPAVCGGREQWEGATPNVGWAAHALAAWLPGYEPAAQTWCTEWDSGGLDPPVDSRFLCRGTHFPPDGVIPPHPHEAAYDAMEHYLQTGPAARALRAAAKPSASSFVTAAGIIVPAADPPTEPPSALTTGSPGNGSEWREPAWRYQPHDSSREFDAAPRAAWLRALRATLLQTPVKHALHTHHRHHSYAPDPLAVAKHTDTVHALCDILEYILVIPPPTPVEPPATDEKKAVARDGVVTASLALPTADTFRSVGGDDRPFDGADDDGWPPSRRGPPSPPPRDYWTEHTRVSCAHVWRHQRNAHVFALCAESPASAPRDPTALCPAFAVLVYCAVDDPLLAPAAVTAVEGTAGLVP